MELGVFAWVQGALSRVLVEDATDSERVELVGVPLGRARPLRDRVPPALAIRRRAGCGGPRVAVAPPIDAGTVKRLELGMFLAIAAHGDAPACAGSNTCREAPRAYAAA